MQSGPELWLLREIFSTLKIGLTALRRCDDLMLLATPRRGKFMRPPKRSEFL